MKVLVFILFALFVFSQSQYAYQKQFTADVECSTEAYVGTLYFQNNCYKGYDNQYKKYTCDSTKTTVHSKCDSKCEICEGKLDISTKCLRVGNNSIKFLCGKPNLKPKGFAYTSHGGTKCDRNTGTTIYFSDAHCSAPGLDSKRTLGLFKGIKLNSTSVSILSAWNEKKRGLEYSVHSDNECKSDRVSTRFFPEKQCIQLGQYSMMYSKVTNEKGEVIKGVSIFDAFIAMLPFGKKESLVRVAHENHKKYGNVHMSYMLWMDGISVNSPELAKKILTDSATFPKLTMEANVADDFKHLFANKHVVGANGDDWKRQRKSIDPAFYDLSLYSNVFIEKSKTVFQLIDSKKDGILDNFNQVMKNMTLDVLGKTIFGHEFNSVLDSNQTELLAYHDLVGSLLDMKSAMIIILFSKLKSCIPFLSKLSKNIRIFDDLTDRLIEISKEKMKKQEESNSMLDFMVKSTFEDENMTLEELKSNIFAFFVAGHETTATTLSFIIQLLAKHQDVQDKARKEILNICPDEKDLDYAITKKFDYILMIIKETLRLFPPASVINRKIGKDVDISGFKAQKGKLAIVNVFSLHRNDKVYKNPEEFRPERWVEDDIPSYAWIPFSIGSRVCVGNNFSLAEQKFFLSALLRRYKFTLVDDGDVVESPVSFLITALERKIKFERFEQL
eukprot:gene5827-9650_t